MQMIFRVVAWLLLIAIVALSFVPASDRPMTGASSNLEHLAIYLATGFAFAFGYSDRLMLMTGALTLFSGLVEIVQIWAPGRHARLGDFLIDAVAAGLGIAAFIVMKRIVPRVFAY